VWRILLEYDGGERRPYDAEALKRPAYEVAEPQLSWDPPLAEVSTLGRQLTV